LLTALLAASAFLRSRLYPIVKQRLAWLAAGATAVIAVLIAVLSGGIVVPVALLLAVGAVVIGLLYSVRPPNPYLSRAAEILELLVTLSLVPVAAGVLGLYGLLRGWGG
jgi:hypothetical protein